MKTRKIAMILFLVLAVLLQALGTVSASAAGSVPADASGTDPAFAPGNVPASTSGTDPATASASVPISAADEETGSSTDINPAPQPVAAESSAATEVGMDSTSGDEPSSSVVIIPSAQLPDWDESTDLAAVNPSATQSDADESPDSVNTPDLPQDGDESIDFAPVIPVPLETVESTAPDAKAEEYDDPELFCPSLQILASFTAGDSTRPVELAVLTEVNLEQIPLYEQDYTFYDPEKGIFVDHALGVSLNDLAEWLTIDTGDIEAFRFVSGQGEESAETVVPSKELLSTERYFYGDLPGVENPSGITVIEEATCMKQDVETLIAFQDHWMTAEEYLDPETGIEAMTGEQAFRLLPGQRTMTDNTMDLRLSRITSIELILRGAPSLRVTPEELTGAPGVSIPVGITVDTCGYRFLENLEINWRSEDETAVTVDSSGMVTIQSRQPAAITAAAGGMTCRIPVNQPLISGQEGLPVSGQETQESVNVPEEEKTEIPEIQTTTGTANPETVRTAASEIETHSTHSGTAEKPRNLPGTAPAAEKETLPAQPVENTEAPQKTTEPVSSVTTTPLSQETGSPSDIETVPAPDRETDISEIPVVTAPKPTLALEAQEEVQNVPDSLIISQVVPVPADGRKTVQHTDAAEPLAPSTSVSHGENAGRNPLTESGSSVSSQITGTPAVRWPEPDKTLWIQEVTLENPTGNPISEPPSIRPDGSAAASSGVSGSPVDSAAGTFRIYEMIPVETEDLPQRSNLPFFTTDEANLPDLQPDPKTSRMILLGMLLAFLSGLLIPLGLTYLNSYLENWKRRPAGHRPQKESNDEKTKTGSVKELYGRTAGEL